MTNSQQPIANSQKPTAKSQQRTSGTKLANHLGDWRDGMLAVMRRMR